MIHASELFTSGHFARMSASQSLDDWLAQKPRVSVGLSEGGLLSAIVVEFDGRVLLTELAWLHRMAPHLFIRVLPIETGWEFRPR